MRLRRKLMVIAASVGLIGAVLATGAAFGLHDINAEDDDAILQLHLGANDYFAHDGLQQDINTSKCEITLTGDALVSLTGSDKGPGEKADSIGIKSGGAQGTACGRVDTSEDITIALDGPDIGDQEIERAELDVEVKKNVIVQADTQIDGNPVGTYFLRTGTSIIVGQGNPPAPGPDGYPRVVESNDTEPVANCGSQSDSGPDSGANDNCRWEIVPTTPFDSITFTALVGEFGLEGGADGTPAGTMAPGFAGSDSLFFLTDIDGILACGDTVRESEGSLVGTFTRIDDSGAGGTCDLKPYNLVIDALGETISFTPEGDPATYSAILTKSPDPSGTVPIVPTLEYDDFTVGTNPANPDNDGFRDMLTCDSATFGTTTFDPDGPGPMPSETIPIVTSASIPASDDPGRPHTFCIARVTGESSASFTWEWLIFGFADPNYGWR